MRLGASNGSAMAQVSLSEMGCLRTRATHGCRPYTGGLPRSGRTDGRQRSAPVRPRSAPARSACAAAAPGGSAGWKRQPDGGRTRSGGDPGMPISRFAPRSWWGTSSSAPGCTGARVARTDPRGRHLDQFAGVHDPDPVGELDQQRQVVRDEQDREAEAAPSAPGSPEGSASAPPRRARSSARP